MFVFKRRMLFLFLLALLLIPTATAMMQDGGKGDEIPTANEEIDTEDWVTLEGEGVTLLVPPTWIDMNADVDDLMASLEDADSNIDLEALADMAASLGDVYLMFAMNTEASDVTFTTNLNVVGLDIGATMPMEMLLDANIDAMRATMPDIEGEIIEINDEEVGNVFAAYELNGLNVQQVQYYFMRDTWLYVVTFTTTDDYFEELEPEFAAIAETLETEND